MNAIRLHQIEALPRDDEFMVFKSTNHLVAMYDFLSVVSRCCENPRIVWLHRDPVPMIRSTIPFMKAIQKRFVGDLGVDDVAALNTNTIRFTEVQLRNALAAREAWLAENPDNKKMLLDVSFKKLVSEPKETVKEIYSYFGMDFAADVEAKLDATLADQNTQKKVKYVPPPEFFTFDEADTRKKFEFYNAAFPDLL